MTPNITQLALSVRIKVLAISGEDNNGQILKIMQAGADGFVAKHCTIEELTNAITNL